MSASNDDGPLDEGGHLPATVARTGGALALAGDLAPLRAALAKYERARGLSGEESWCGVGWLGAGWESRVGDQATRDYLRDRARENAEQLSLLENQVPATITHWDRLGREVAEILRAVPLAGERSYEYRVYDAFEKLLGAKLADAAAMRGDAPYNLLLNRIAAVAETTIGRSVVPGGMIFDLLNDAVSGHADEVVEGPTFDWNEYRRIGDHVNDLTGLVFFGRGRFGLNAEYLRALGLGPGAAINRETAHSVIENELRRCRIWKNRELVGPDNQLVREVCGSIERGHHVHVVEDAEQGGAVEQRAPSRVAGDDVKQVLDLQLAPAPAALEPPLWAKIDEHLVPDQGSEVPKAGITAMFPDVPSNKLFAAIIAWGKERGVTIDTEAKRGPKKGGFRAVVGVRLRDESR